MLIVNFVCIIKNVLAHLLQLYTFFWLDKGGMLCWNKINNVETKMKGFGIVNSVIIHSSDMSIIQKFLSNPIAAD